MRHVQPRHRAKQFACEVDRPALADGREGELARLRFGQRNQLAHCRDRHSGIDHQIERREKCHRHRRKILGRIVGHFLLRVDVDRETGDTAEEQGVAIGRCFGHHLGADHLARTGLVFNHEGLTQFAGETLCDGARDGIADAAGRIGHDDAHRLGRVGLCLRQRGCGGCPHHERTQRKETTERIEHSPIQIQPHAHVVSPV